MEGVTAPIIKSNDFFGGYMATQHLWKQGYRDIAYLAAPRYRTSVDRCQGYISALQHRGMEINRKRILMLDDGTTGECYDKLTDLLESDLPVDAVFCFNEEIAFEAIRAVEDTNQRVSADIGIIGYGDTIHCENGKVSLTTVSSKIEDVGRMAARVLGKMVEKQERDAFAYYLIEPSIVVRESCLGRDNTGRFPE